MMGMPATLVNLGPFDFEAMRAAAFAASVEAERTRRRERMLAWRADLQAGVVAVSPALLDMAALRGVDLGRVCRRLRPPTAWRGQFPLSAGGGWDEVWPWAPDPRPRSIPFVRSARATRVVRARAVPPSHPDGAFTVAVDGRALSGCAPVGSADLATHGGSLRLWFRARLPETVLMAASGKRADRLLDHPVLSGRPYLIVRASDEGFATMVEVETGLVPFAMPWPGLAAAASSNEA